MKKKCLRLFFILCFGKVFAQEYPRKSFNISQLQSLLPVQKGDVNYEQLYESLFQFYQNPLDLNTCNRDELSALFVLNETQLNSFFEYRLLAGKLLSIYELQAVPNFDLTTIYRLLPFVWVRPEGLTLKSLQKSIEGLDNQFLVFRIDQDFEQSKGFSPPTSSSKSRYLGSPQHYFLRYRLATSKDISLGFTLEKDAGETLAWQPSQNKFGADFFSFHFNLQNKGRWKSINLGDYQLQIGQGLVLSSGFFIGKGGETVLTTRRSHLGLRPYTSSMEYNYFRGVAATYQLDNVEITAFVSRNRRDGNLIAEPKNLDEPYVSSLQTTGYHRTASEQADAGSLSVQDIGTDISYRLDNNRFQIGITAMQTNFDKDLIKDPKKIYNRYEFSGSQNLMLAGHYNYLWQNMSFFGEIARSSSGGIGIVNGLLASVSKRWDYSLILRHFDKNYHSFYGNAFGENTRNINETGLYLGTKFTLNKRWQAGAYIDYYRFPYQKYLVSQPSDGFEFLLRGIFTPTKTRQYQVQFHEEHKQKDVPARLSKLDITVATTRRNVLFSYDDRLANHWEIGTKFLASSFAYKGFEASRGFAVVQDVSRNFTKFSLTGRLAYFKTDDYDSRLYVYENDVLYAFSIPAYFDEGFRAYLMAQTKLGKHLTAWLRVSRTQLLNQASIGSGLDEIPVPHRTDIRLQLRYVF